MKIKRKSIISIIICIVLVLLNVSSVFAAREDNEIVIEACKVIEDGKDKSIIKKGGTIEVTLDLKSFSDENIKIDTLLATIEYDEDVFEPLPDDIFHDEEPDFEGPYELYGLDGWAVEGANPRSKKFIIHRPSPTNATRSIFKLTLTVQNDIDIMNLTEDQRTVKFINISASGEELTNFDDLGYEGDFGVINKGEHENEAWVTLDVQQEDFALSSEDYFINDTDQTIELVAPETSIQTFLDSFETNAQTITIEMGEKTINVTVEDGKYSITSPTEAELPRYIGTNAQITFNYYSDDPYVYHISVLGDLNGDGKISPTDYSIFAKHLTGTKPLTDVAKLKSANLDFKSEKVKQNGEEVEEDITQTDRAEMAKILVGLTEIDTYIENGKTILMPPPVEEPENGN